MSDGVKVTFYCEHVAPNHVHCNRYTTVSSVGAHEAPRNVIKDTEWTYVDGEVRCPQHH
ncbi:hypothetical protein PN419_00500 [Halorubrum ezzemoulense]|uniref:hypothetical protein n=1 Tax=Halorubrum ezzemoulense TaxID=337243 RepID=UPI00233075AC|nr:hypothetical protein [Halorubrum ezzemoulense]MDB9247487.1 hypothetical protein [Halorubrum ezzemoulense]MDB9258604.1 hypothetical protein [Halorubrum ezzemoulense]MDB9264537.1 hypothetical protein [Halorubrum ezzemoulense]MDB9268965.1 hypothetical protein [Halorubrum ezzemoulense]MDB9271505.1 hypothetical protein [Halorubrum ezzemoulense]